MIARAKVYLHCGWPKTGTSSLQAALVRNEDLLAQFGIDYPERWRRSVDGSHNDLVDLLKDDVRSKAGFEDVVEFVEALSDRVALLSSESLTAWFLADDESSEALLRMLAAMRGAGSVRTVWTLRRFDDMVHSLAVQLAVARRYQGREPEAMLDGLRFDALFDRMLRAESVMEHEAAYVRYEPTGTHYRALLRAFDLPAAIGDAIGTELAAKSKLNAGRSQKQIAALSNLDILSDRAGIELSRREVMRAFDERAFRFQDDRPCVLFEPEVRRELHGQMLVAARECGFRPYVTFFGDESMEKLPPQVDLDPEVIGDDDLRGLVDTVRETRVAQ